MFGKFKVFLRETVVEVLILSNEHRPKLRIIHFQLIKMRVTHLTMIFWAKKEYNPLSASLVDCFLSSCELFFQLKANRVTEIFPWVHSNGVFLLAVGCIHKAGSQQHTWM